MWRTSPIQDGFDMNVAAGTTLLKCANLLLNSSKNDVEVICVCMNTALQFFCVESFCSKCKCCKSPLEIWDIHSFSLFMKVFTELIICDTVFTRPCNSRFNSLSLDVMSVKDARSACHCGSSRCSCESPLSCKTLDFRN